ncbi:MAG: ABC transporter substrate-binding protein [Candidatus Acidiferrales bacterium]
MLVLAAVQAMMSGLSPAQAAPLTIRIGWVGVPNSWAPLFEAKKDIAKHYGKSYVLELTRYRGTGPQISALASDNLDIAPLAFSGIIAAVQNGGLDDLRVIMDEKQDGVPGTYSTEFMVLKNSPIKKIEDLRGKVLATNGIGGGWDMATRAILLKHGMVDQRDYSVIEVGLPNMLAVLVDKKADLITAPLPFSANPKLRELGRTLYTFGDAFGGPVGAAQLCARAGFIEKNRAAMLDFTEDAISIIRWYWNPANHAAVVALVAKLSGQKPETLDSWLFVSGKDNYRDVNGIPNIAAIQKNFEVQKSLGLVKEVINAKEHSDLTLIGDALKRLGGAI